MRASFAIVVVLLASAAACGGPVGSGAPTPRSDGPGAASPTEPPPAATSTARGATPSSALARHLTYALTDVRTSERFTLGGFSGKVVLVQAMAVW